MCIRDSSRDQWMPWPHPRIGRTVRSLKDEVFIAQAGLASVIKAIVPLQLKHYNQALTREYLDATFEIHQKLLEFWDSIDPALRSIEVLDEAPPHVFMVG